MTNRFEELFNKVMENNTEHFNTLMGYWSQANQQITSLTDQVNKLTIEVDQLIQFQRWLMDEMNKTDEEPVAPFEPVLMEDRHV